jgi:hypothetical protein
VWGLRTFLLLPLASMSELTSVAVTADRSESTMALLAFLLAISYVSTQTRINMQRYRERDSE